MKNKLGAISAILFCLGALCITIPITRAALRPAPEPLAISTVIVRNIDRTGHGSGVHIGNGYILTAAHVVDGQSSMDVIDSRGNTQSGAILWSNKDYDVAMIRVRHGNYIAASSLDCRARLMIGDDISAFGNPLNLEFVRTYGKVASTYGGREPWKSSFIASIAVAPGMSGGPIFDHRDNVVGIAVGLVARPFMVGGMAPFAISYVVPASAVCMLMGRDA